MTDSVDEPKEKKLKSSEPDLKITVSNQKENKIVVHHCLSTIMANQSHYIDAMLASNMIESQTCEMSFPDIPPPIWDKMIGVLEDPTQARRMTVQDAMLVAPHYNKYDFSMGLQLCTQVLTDYIRKKHEDPDLDLLIEIALLADDSKLEAVKVASLKDLRYKFERPETRIMFSKEHVKKLVPLITNDRGLLYALQSTKEEVLNPLFPKFLVRQFAAWQIQQFLSMSIPQIRLSGSRCNADGVFDRDWTPWEWVCSRKGTWADQEIEFWITSNDDCEIVGKTLPEIDEDGEADYETVESKVLWRCPNSRNMSLPPRTGWKPVDELALGTPKVDYIFCEQAPDASLLDSLAVLNRKVCLTGTSIKPMLVYGTIS